MNKFLAILIEKLTLLAFGLLSIFIAAEKLEKWKPVHLCWWYYKNDIPIPKYFIGMVSAPTVTTQAATSVSYTTATANGNITGTGLEKPSRRGVCYMVGTAGDPTTANSVAYIDGSFSTGAFTQALGGLAPGTGYRVRAYAINSAGTGYGATVQLTTLTNTPPTVALNSPADGSSSLLATPTLNFTGTDAQSEAIEYNVQVSTTGDFGQTPILIGSSGNTWNSVTGSVRTTGSLSWQSGDVILVVGVVENNNQTLTVPTATGLSFSILSGFPTNTANTTKMYAWSATAGSSGSGAVSSNVDTTDVMANIQAYVYRGSSGIGNTTVSVAGAANTISLTRSGTGSAVIWVGGDWAATNDTTIAGVPSGSTQQQAAYISARATMFAFSWTGQGAAGTTSYGISGFSTTGPFGNLAIEIKGNAGTSLVNAFSASDPGFTAGHPYASGSAINYTTTPLATGTYYWRVAGIDPTGSNTYGAWSSTRSLIITEPPFTIAGTSNQTSGTVAVAVNSNLQGSTGTIAGDGTWSISGVTKPSAGDAITVFISDATTANVSTAVATYFGVGAVSAMVLNKHVLSIGSNQNMIMTLADLGKYDYDQNTTKILHSANGSPATLLLDPGGLYTDEKINILAGNTLTVGATETLTAYDVTIAGTLTSLGASTFNISHDWVNSGTFTAGKSTVKLNGSTKQSLSGTMTGVSAFYNLQISNNSGSSATDNERTGFVPGADFNAAATVNGAYLIDTGNVRVEYETGATYEFNTIDWTGATGQLICFRNSTTSGTWILKSTKFQMDVSYVNVSRSNASVSGGLQVGAFNATNYDGGNNTNWLFVNKRVRQEINILSGTFYSLSTAGVLAGYASLYNNFGGTLTSYFEIVVVNNDSTARTIYLRNQSDASIVGQIDIPAGTSSPTFFRSVPFTYPASAINVYIDIPQTTSDSQVVVSAGRVIVLQDLGAGLITATETQIEVGNYESGRSNTASTPLAYPKYWKYTAASWVPSPSFAAEVTYDTSDAATNAQTTITLQKDNNGDLVTWSDVIQIIANSTSVSATLSSRVGFTPVTGCNYRIASFVKSASYSYTIYNAKIIAVQTGSDISRLEPQYLLQNTYKNVTGLQDYDTILSPLDWYGANMAFYHEINTSSSTTASAKLQSDPNGTPVDFIGSTATGSSYVSRSVALALTHANLFDINIIATPIYASRIIAVLDTGVAGTGIKVWNGTSWAYKPAKVWTGSAWVAKPVKVWNGSSWITKG